MNTPEDQKPGTPNPENPNEPGQKKVKTNDPPKMSFWKKTGIIAIIAVISALALIYFFRPNPDKKEQVKTEEADSTNTQPTAQNGLQITFNYSQICEWNGLDPKEQTRLKAIEVETNKLIMPINVNLKDIIETGKKKVTNYQNKGYDMVQLQYVENGNLKTIFTKPGNIAIAL